ncbi:MBL fold metallo-hydrolase [Planctobacterium marinum]|uniref:Metallo-beta-lactamase domain-containing protein n=1 Tax=Planctobacterium marinum TaxID=1631968 RepID=A0AA48HN94_9ALTE|nr:hypothetical protein MACH26_34370 [Planctobacterium marinum]
MLTELRKMPIFALLLYLNISYCFAHGDAQYLGNSAVLVESKGKKVLFDPFFHNDFGVYQLVPQHLQQAIIRGEAPYDDIDLIVISHAHEDHFSALDVANYLQRFPKTKLIAPQQAIDLLKEYNLTASQLIGFDLSFNAPPQSKQVAELIVQAVRIPHAGWPARKDVQNIVFRIELGDAFSAMHMGDADPNDDHYLPYKTHWQNHETSVNFPPYWFFMSLEGRDILNEILQVEQHIGVHVPKEIPQFLKHSSYPYFSIPGERRQFHK